MARGRPEVINEPLLTLDEAVAEREAVEGGNGTLKALVPCLPLKKSASSSPAPNGAPPAHEKLASSEAEAEFNESQHPGEKRDTGDIEMASDSKSKTVCADAPADVIDACRAANAHDFICSFPQGYETDIGEGSIMVSGGQKQRIAIARALIKKPAVLLLDEATSALDANSERIVQQSIDALAQSKAQTTIIIAHRLTTIRNADKIYVIDKGHIVEMGKHDELLSMPEGLYKQLWEKQHGGGSVSPSPSKAQLTSH